MSELIRLQGMMRTTKILTEFPGRVQKRVLRKAVRAGGAVMLKTVRRNAPRLTGRFKRSLTQKQKVYPSGTAVAIIGQQKNKRIKAVKKLKKGRGGISGRGQVVPIHLIDQPVRPHQIAADLGSALAIAGLAGQVTVKSVRHPGMRGRKFMERSARSAEAEAVSALSRKMDFEIDREASILARENPT